MPDTDIWIEEPKVRENPSLPLCHWVIMPGRYLVAASMGHYPWLIRWQEPLVPQQAGAPLPLASTLCQQLAAIAALDDPSHDGRPVLEALRAFYRAHGRLGLTGQLLHEAGTPPRGLPWPERAEPVVIVLRHAHEIGWYYKLLQALLEPDQPRRRQRLQHALGPVPQSYAVRVVPERRQRGRRVARRVCLHIEALVAEDEPLQAPLLHAPRHLASSQLRYNRSRQCVVSICPDLPATPEIQRYRRAGMSFWWLAPGFHELRTQAQGTPGLGPARPEEVEEIAGAVFTDGIRTALVEVPADAPPTLFSHIYSRLAQELLQRLPWRQCEWCGALIAARRPRQRFCNADCAKEWHNATRSDPDLGKSLPDGVWQQVRELLLPPLAQARTCHYCFEPLPRRRRRFCRESCANAWRKAQWRRRQAGVTLPDTRYPASITPGDPRYPSLDGLPLAPSVVFQIW